MKILTVVGARPQFIKAAAVSRAFQDHHALTETVVHTGQHFDDSMSEVFFHELNIREPKWNLGINGGSHGAQTGKMLQRLEEIMIENLPDLVLVYGDTNSTLAGALAAAKLNIRLAHVEAGLRSYNRAMPEEINRILTDHISDVLFAPTDLAVINLADEGIVGSRVLMIGDVMYDASQYYATRSDRKEELLDRLKIDKRNYILCTVHRAENTDDPKKLRTVFGALMELAREILVVLPLHPRTKEALLRNGILSGIDKVIRIIEPVGYLDMITLERNARLILTDSGGVQKEAFFYSVPCVTLRGETEWGELIEHNWNRLAPPVSTEVIMTAVRDAIDSVGDDVELYGGGNAAQSIAECLRDL